MTSNSGKVILQRFPYPVTIAFVQLGCGALYAWLWAHALAWFEKRRRAWAAEATPSPVSPAKVASRACLRLGLWDFDYHMLITMLPVSVAQIAGHVLHHFAVSHVTVALVHMIKALAPLFTVLVYSLLLGVRYPGLVFFSMVPLIVGVFLGCSYDVSFNMVGVVYALTSCMVFVGSNVYSKCYIFPTRHEDEGPTKGSHFARDYEKLHVIFLISSLSFVLMGPMWYLSEGHKLLAHNVFSSVSEHGVASGLPPHVALLLLLNGFTHFAQNVLAVSVLSQTSAVTFSVASLFKRVFVIVTSILYFSQPVSLPQGVGIVLTFLGLALYDRNKKAVAAGERQVLSSIVSLQAPPKAQDAAQKLL